MDYTLDKKLICFKQIAQEKLQAILCSIPSRKDLIIEPSLIKPLEHICMASWVKSKGVLRIYKFDQKHAAPRQGGVTQVFLISSNILVFKHVLDQIHAYESENPSKNSTGIKDYHVIVLPTVYSCFQTLLEEEGLYGLVTMHKFSWDFIHLDASILSLEMPQVFSEVFIRKDTSLLSSLAHSLRLLQMVAGSPDIILSYGFNSVNVLEIINRLTTSKTSSKSSDFTAMIIMDRDKDYPSCLLTPAIYSGLLLEVFKCRAGELDSQARENKISAGKLEIFKGPSVSSTSKTKSTTNIQMNGKYDEIFEENRYKHFAEASNLVRAQAKALGVEVQNINKMKINEMQQYVTKKLPKITEMKNKILKHLNVCEEIIKELAGNFQRQLSLEDDILNNANRKQILSKIDETLTVDGHKFNTIRLLCLAHLSIGLTPEELSSFIKNYCNVFGHKFLYVFQPLSTAGLLPEIELSVKSKLLPNLAIPKFQQTEFQTSASRLKLLPPEAEKSRVPESAKTCPSYVFNGLYIPVVAQLASIILKAESIEEINTKLGMMEKIQLRLSNNPDMNNLKLIHQAVKKGDIPDMFPLKKRTILVFVIGGITYAEISACDLIGRLTGSKIVMTSNVICSGADIISAAF